jgi:hypothetical protein
MKRKEDLEASKNSEKLFIEVMERNIEVMAGEELGLRMGVGVRVVYKYR